MRVGQIQFNGIGADETFPCFVAAGALEGDAVTGTATAGTVGRGAAGDRLLGKLEKVEPDSVGTVLTEGVITFELNGALAPGMKQLAVDGAGKIQAGSAGPFYWVISVQGTKADVLLT